MCLKLCLVWGTKQMIGSSVGIAGKQLDGCLSNMNDLVGPFCLQGTPNVPKSIDLFS